MVDPQALLLSYLQSHASLTGVQIVAGRNDPPQGWTPATGQLVVFKQRGGFGSFEDDHLLPSFQFKCYGTAEANAYACYQKLRNAVHQQSGGYLKWGEEESLGQPLYEETGWPFMLTFVNATLKNV